ncbi:hypothetical protein JTE90_006631 [Oedothorax gibbosus]|uniref:Uncharacterized protein n=1 Tax=Oedothorax gibbosus TaxID=931172 RepID=A0AAV6U7Y2_9ARAC|nr:hypothetical protein JTE90_006631 [Oedothorax gibbosus]
MGNIEGVTSTGMKITLKDVLFVPKINGQLISVKSIESAGYTLTFKNEKVYASKNGGNRSSNRITVSRNVTFNEKKNSISSPSLITTQNIEDSSESESEQADAPEHTADPIVPPESETRRSTRTRKPVVKFPHPEVYAATNAEETFSYKELCERPTAEQRPWRKAMKEEINSMNENQVWELQHPPPGVKPITSKWIYKKKRDDYNTNERTIPDREESFVLYDLWAQLPSATTEKNGIPSVTSPLSIASCFSSVAVSFIDFKAAISQASYTILAVCILGHRRKVHW